MKRMNGELWPQCWETERETFHTMILSRKRTEPIAWSFSQKKNQTESVLTEELGHKIRIGT